MKGVIVFVMLVSMVSADLIYDEWLSNGENFKVGDVRMNVIWTGESAFVKFNDKGFDLVVGECEGSGILTVCLTDIRMIKGGEEVPLTINDPYAEVEMQIEVNASIAELEIDQTVESNELEMNEKSRVDVVITNNGLTSTDVTFENTYPSELMAKPIKGCKSNDNDIVWEGSIKKNEKHLLSYEITGIEPVKYSSKATAEYFNGIKTEKAISTTKFTVLEPALNINVDTHTRLTSGDTSVVNINISKNYAAVLDVHKIELITTSGLTVLEPYELHNFQWDENEDDYLSIQTTVKAIRIGEQYLSVLVQYDTESVSQDLNESIRFNVKKDVELETDFDVPDLIVGRTTPVKISLFNPGENALDLKVVLESDLPGLTAENTQKMFGIRNTFTVLDSVITPEAAGTYLVNLSISYQNAEGEIFKETLSQSVDVRAAGKKANDEEIPEESPLPGLVKQGKRSFRFTGITILLVVFVAAMLLLYIRHKVRE